jgi:class 3 adenylate cyclase
MVRAATFPQRTVALALVDCFATMRRFDDYPWGFPPDALEKRDAAALASWGSAPGLRILAPGLADDERFRDWWARSQRGYMSQSMMAVAQRIMSGTDLRGILSSIEAPTLVISHTEHPWLRLGHGKYLAEHIPGARYIERQGFSGIEWLDDADWTLDEVQSFFTGTRGESGIDDRVLATILFTDIVGSTERAAEIGDQRWRYLLDEHDRITRREIERFRGRLVKSTGDGLLATFDGPARAIRCARALADAVRPLGIEVRTGLHTGEIELRDDDVGGIAVHIAARVMGEAGAGEVLVSGAVPPLVAGAEIDFEDRGERVLKGVPGAWRLFAVKT